MDNIRLNLKRYNTYNITVVGVGGTGSNLLPPLTQLINTIKKDTTVKLKVIDGDRFEIKNMNNQKCIEIDVGKSKSEVIASRYKRVYPELDITYSDEYIYNKNDITFGNRGYFSSYNTINILIGCVDNNATRKLMNDVFNDSNNIIYIDSGNGTENRVGQIIIGLKIDGKVILEPVATMFPEILTDNDTVESQVGCAVVNEKSPQNISTNLLASTIIFSVLNNILAFNYIDNYAIFFNADGISVNARKINMNHIQANNTKVA